MKQSHFVKSAHVLTKLANEQPSGFRPYYGPHGAGAGAALGGLVGGGLGLASGLLQDDEEQAPWYKRLLKGALVGAGAGALGGSAASVMGRNKRSVETGEKVLEKLGPAKLMRLDGQKFADIITDESSQGLKDVAVPWKQLLPAILKDPDARRAVTEHNKPVIRDTQKRMLERILTEGLSKNDPVEQYKRTSRDTFDRFVPKDTPGRSTIDGWRERMVDKQTEQLERMNLNQ